MEENGNMKWNSTDGYVTYKVALNFLEEALGVSSLNFSVKPDLAPYTTKILEYLNKKIVGIGEDSDMIDKVQLILDTYDYGETYIVNLDSDTLAAEVGVTDSLTDTNDVLYHQERFVYSWTNLITSLAERLKIQYMSLLYQPTSQGCSCNCGVGDNWKSYESYTSGINPEDEEYSSYDFTGATTSTLSNTDCSCGTERMKSEYLSSNA